MQFHKPLQVVTLTVTITFLAGGAAPPRNEGMLIFKDGYIIQGAIKQQTELVFDNGQLFPMSTGSFCLDDGVCRIGFAKKQLADVVRKEAPNQIDRFVFSRLRCGMVRMPAIVGIDSVGDWKWLPKVKQWRRALRIETSAGRQFLAWQRMAELTPSYARADGVFNRWIAYYRISELNPQIVRELLSHLPKEKAKAKEKGKAKEKTKADNGDLARRYRLFRFFAQAGWYDEAAKELDKILKDLPREKEKIAACREDLKKLQTLELAEGIERAYKAGQHHRVQQLLDVFTGKGVEEKIQTRILDLRTKYEKADTSLKQAQHFLEDLPTQLDVTSQRQLFQEAAAAIRAELTLDDFLPDSRQNKMKIQRLEPFLILVAQAQRDRAKGRAATNSPAQLLALAISGWFLGKESAETKVAIAERLWRARCLLIAYLKAQDPRQRQKLLEAYQSQRSDAVTIDEIAQLISVLPSPDPVKPSAGGSPQEFQTRGLGRRQEPIPYLVQLPPEYHPGRAYPVLFALHGENEKPKDMLLRCGPLAAQYGYILVAPEWNNGLTDTYNYTPDEHAAVIEVLRDLRRQFQVDSDRVFLLGLGEGATMAYDVGLSHPDLFAGVVPVEGFPDKFAKKYTCNAQYLPFYAVAGEWSGAITKQNREQLDKFVTQGYPALYIEYKGRGHEWFAGELPNIFAWMDHQRRARAVPLLGKNGNGGPLGQEFQTMRTTDNRFYWLSTSAIAPGRLNDPRRFRMARTPATLQGRIGTDNRITVNTLGINKVTVWLRRDMMIDFDKNVVIVLNSRLVFNRRVKPSLAVLLEDLYLRGDRQRLFFATIDFDRP